MPDSRDVPPKKRGRFIPCRGGGTATTYYTDFHDIDEDRAAILFFNGHRADAAYAGITQRNMTDAPTTTLAAAASRLIYLS